MTTRLTVRANGDANSYALLDDNGNWFMSLLVNGQQMEAKQVENLRRLAACWNVCDGMDTELLENILMLGDTMATRFQARDRVEEIIIADRLRLMQERDALQVTITSIMEAVGRKQMADFIEKFGAPPPDTTITTNSVCGKPGKTCKWVATEPYGSKCTTCGDTIPF